MTCGFGRCERTTPGPGMVRLASGRYICDLCDRVAKMVQPARLALSPRKRTATRRTTEARS